MREIDLGRRNGLGGGDKRRKLAEILRKKFTRIGFCYAKSFGKLFGRESYFKETGKSIWTAILILIKLEKHFCGKTYFKEVGKSIWTASLVLRKLENCFGGNPCFKEAGKSIWTASLVLRNREKCFGGKSLF